jgi:hypothetical protein
MTRVLIIMVRMVERARCGPAAKLFRYLEHFFFFSFGSTLYTTCWKAKSQGQFHG